MDKYSFSNTQFNLYKTNEYFNNGYDFLLEKWNNNPRFKNYIITLSDDEMKLVNAVATKRFCNNRMLGRDGGYMDREILGTSGEYAVLKYLSENGFNVSFDRFNESIDVKLSYTDDCDAELQYNNQNYRLEVKTTEKPLNAKLIVPKNQYKSKNHSDVYILVCKLADNIFCIKGFAKHSDFTEDYSLRSPGYSIHEKCLAEKITYII